MYDRDAALRHQIANVAITQLISDIPSYSLNDQEMIEMAAFEEFGLLGRELGHAGDFHNDQICTRTAASYRSVILPLSNSFYKTEIDMKNRLTKKLRCLRRAGSSLGFSGQACLPKVHHFSAVKPGKRTVMSAPA